MSVALSYVPIQTISCFYIGGCINIQECSLFSIQDIGVLYVKVNEVLPAHLRVHISPILKL